MEFKDKMNVRVKYTVYENSPDCKIRWESGEIYAVQQLFGDILLVNGRRLITSFADYSCAFEEVKPKTEWVLPNTECCTERVITLSSPIRANFANIKFSSNICDDIHMSLDPGYIDNFVAALLEIKEQIEEGC